MTLKLTKLEYDWLRREVKKKAKSLPEQELILLVKPFTTISSRILHQQQLQEIKTLKLLKKRFRV
jgi:hypothetical protein